MENSFFILSDHKIDVLRFHICTWDIENSKSYVEIGVDFNNLNIPEINFKFVAPFVKESTIVRCLAENLNKDSNNIKFIFNDNVQSANPLKGDNRNGQIVTFENKTDQKLAILPIESLVIEHQIISFRVKAPKLDDKTNCYIRFIIEVESKSLSTIKKGIANESYIHDIKVNEMRNLPNRVHTLLREEYIFSNIENCFCLHVIPNAYNISFVDQNKLKNVRELEVEAFKRYLPDELKTMKSGKYMIVFNKMKKETSYSFFTIFTKEIIGTNQILLAIGANILCSLLFALSSVRQDYDTNKTILEQIPGEYWVITLILIILLGLLFKEKLRISK